MRSECAQPHPRKTAVLSANTAGAIVALMAIAMTVGAVQGATAAGLSEGMAGARPMLRESSTARAVAAAVTAAVRDMVGHDTIDGSVPFECADSLAWIPTPAADRAAPHEVGRSHAPPIAPRLLNIPPPTN